ncbi:MAG: hypothetical protein C0475_00200 [Planctomyces sp.]|nr:hypothetical protein [Planctomyces sp.]
MTRRPHAHHPRRAFTLLEIMLVVLIMGILATIGVVAISSNLERARLSETRTYLSQIRTALTDYNANTGAFPASLAELASGTGANRYLQRIPQDGWKQDFLYRFPGQSGANEDQPYDLISSGRDKQFGTGDDLNVWTFDQRAAAPASN